MLGGRGDLRSTGQGYCSQYLNVHGSQSEIESKALPHEVLSQPIAHWDTDLASLLM